MTNLIINKSGVREHLENNHITSDLFEQVDERVRNILDRAAERAEANGRKTVGARDV